MARNWGHSHHSIWAHNPLRGWSSLITCYAHWQATTTDTRTVTNISYFKLLNVWGSHYRCKGAKNVPKPVQFPLHCLCQPEVWHVLLEHAQWPRVYIMCQVGTMIMPCRLRDSKRCALLKSPLSFSVRVNQFQCQKQTDKQKQFLRLLRTRGPYAMPGQHRRAALKV